MPIARPPDKQVDLLFKWPSPPTGSDTVTVADGDSCVSIQFGHVLGVFEPGTHSLPAQIPDGVELWFCIKWPMTGVKFGGKLPTGGFVHGDYSFRIAAPHLFVPNIANIGSADGFSGFLNTTVLKELVRAFGVTAPTAAGQNDATTLATSRINDALAPMGVRFDGFGSVNVQ